MTIDLGFAWTRLPSGRQVAFVDVPGHERFATNMLAGVGPVPAVMLVIAADEGWAAQTEDHVRALHALGVSHGVVAVTRTDLAEPGRAAAEATERLAVTSLAGIPAVAVSGATGAGIADLRAALDQLAAGLAELGEAAAGERGGSPWPAGPDGPRHAADPANRDGSVPAWRTAGRALATDRWPA